MFVHLIQFLGPNFHRNRDTTSQDSGISQMSVGNDVKNDVVSNNTNGKIHHHESINISGINGINESDIGQYGTAGKYILVLVAWP